MSGLGKIGITILKKTGKMILILLLSFVGVIALYMMCAFGFSKIAVNKNFKNDTTNSAITIYLITNGVHTDLVMPIRTPCKDWSDQLKTEYTTANDLTAHLVAVGWGDKGFYLNTSEWSDLKFSTAFNALFFMSTTALHITFYRNPEPGKSCKKISISAQSYQSIVQYVESYFQKTEKGNYILIKGAPAYGRLDCFFEAKGTYNLFFTCNTWINCALKQGKLKASLWTPFDNGVMRWY